MIKVESFGIVPFLKEQETWKVLLILHSQGNHWGFPKGKANPSESPLETAKRELKEETGLTVAKILLDQPMTEQYQFRRKKQFIVKSVQYFPAFVEGTLTLQEEELRDAQWMTIPDAMARLTFKEARHILWEFVRRLNIQ